jgi:hypothetical protein
MKVNAKRVEPVPLTHQFAIGTCIGIFCNERIRCTPLDPKLMFWGVFAPFRYCTKVGAKRAELVPLTHRFAKQSCVKIFRNECNRSTLLDPKLMFWAHFAPFRYCTKDFAKKAKLVPLTHKFAKRSYIGISHNECTRSTPLDPKLMFWGVSHRFITARKSVKNGPNWCH